MNRSAEISKKTRWTIFLSCLLVLSVSLPATAQNAARKGKTRPASKPARYDPAVPKPTLAEVRYGDHERHVLDFWRVESAEPAPLVFVIHGGGWVGGSKERLQRFVDAPALLQAGVSVAAINYRLIRHAEDDGIEPPVKAPLHDAARALPSLGVAEKKVARDAKKRRPLRSSRASVQIRE